MVYTYQICEKQYLNVKTLKMLLFIKNMKENRSFQFQMDVILVQGAGRRRGESLSKDGLLKNLSIQNIGNFN